MRLTQRRITMADVRHAIVCAERAEPHDSPPEHGGTCWRILGEDIEGDSLTVGIEAYLDVTTLRRFILCTVF